MGTPTLPPLYCLPGCSHLFFSSGMEQSSILPDGERRPLGELSSMGATPNHLSPVRLLEQMEQLRPLNRLAALELQSRRLSGSNLLEQFDCSSNSTRSHFPMGVLATNSDLLNIPGQVRSGLSQSAFKKARSEKKPIPDEHKDDKYYERRKRNNQAAKKSRDARKIREDHIAFRAAILEHENGILRAQLLAMREEIRALRRLLWGNPLLSEQRSNP